MTARPRVRHELKCWPEFFQPTLNYLKRFELRRDDRPEGFQVGYELLLKEWDSAPKFPVYNDGQPIGYTGREVLVRVDWIMDAATVTNLIVEPPGGHLSIGFVIMSVSLVS